MSKKTFIIPIFVPHLGCSHACIFCNQKEITGRTGQPTGLDVAEKINTYLDTMPVNSHVEVAFYGGSFTAIEQGLQKELLAPAYQALNRGLINGIRLSTRPDCIDEDVLSFLSAYGVSVIELGVQSTDEEVLVLAKRGHTLEQTEAAAKLVKSWGFSLGLQMMIGLPGDTAQKDYATARDIIGLRPDFVRIYPALVVKNTELARMYEAGTYFPLSLGKAVEICKKLLLMFEASGIRVIRIGLQPTEEISEGGEVIAGPFHPAFRELVESSVARDQLAYLLRNKGEHKEITLAINPLDASIVRGQKNNNLAWLKEYYGVEKIDFAAKDYIERGTIVLLGKYGPVICRREDLINK